MELISEKFLCKECGYALDQCNGVHKKQLDREKISKALNQFEADVRANERMSNAQKDYVVNQIRYAVELLIDFSETIRDGYGLGYGLRLDPEKLTEMGKPIVHGSRLNVMGVQDALLAAGQDLASLLFDWNLRDKITDVIEEFYGLSFSGLKIYPKAKHKLTGAEVYVTSNHHWDTNVGIMFDGKYEGLTKIKFEEEYELC